MNAREFAADFLENLISFFGVNVLVESSTDPEDENIILLNVPSTRMNGFFIGQRGDNLRSLQNLVNMALKSNGHEEVSVTVDIANYKKQRNQRLERDVQKQAKTVLETGEEQVLEPMNAYERRVVHKALDGIEGITTESAGEGRDRHIVIKKV